VNFYKIVVRSLFFLFLIGNDFVFSQRLTSFRGDNSKWGFKQGEAVIIEPQYDTTFGFDATQQVAMVANLNPKKNFINPLTKEIKKVYDFYYINPENRKVQLTVSAAPLPITEFQNQQRLAKEYLLASNYFKINQDNKIYLFSKTGKQITQSGYDNIQFTKCPVFFVTETKDKTGQTFVGLIDENEKQIIPPTYSKIKINMYDSLIICCTAGVKFNGADDVYNYKGDKLETSAHHVDYAFKEAVVYKLFEPKVSYLIHENEGNKIKPLAADRLYYLKNQNIVMKQGDNYYFYDFKTEKKTPFDKKLYLEYNLNEQD
jgi:hypothetical protein